MQNSSKDGATKTLHVKLLFFERCLYFNSLLSGVVQVDVDVKLSIVCKTAVRTRELKLPCQTNTF